MSAKRRPTHPKQIAALTRRTSPPGSEDDADGMYGWVGEVPAKVRRRRAQSGTSPTSSMPPVSEPPPASVPPPSARRRRQAADAVVAQPRIAYGSDDAFDRRPTLKLKALTQDEIDEVTFDEEIVVDTRVAPRVVEAGPALDVAHDEPGLDVAYEEPELDVAYEEPELDVACEEPELDVTYEEPGQDASCAESGPGSEPWPDLDLDLPGPPSAAPAAESVTLDDTSSMERLLGIAKSIDEVLEGSPPPAHERPIRVSLPLFAAVNLERDDKVGR